MDGGAHSKEAELWGRGKMRKHNRNTSITAKAHGVVGFWVRFYGQGLFQAGTGSSHTRPQWAGHKWAGAVTLQFLWHWASANKPCWEEQDFHLTWRTGLSKLMSGYWKLYRCVFAFVCIRMDQFLSPVYLWLELRLLKLSKGPCLHKHSPVYKKTQNRWWTSLVSACELLLSVELGVKFLCISMRPGHSLTHLKLYFVESNKSTLISGLHGIQMFQMWLFEHFQS